MKKLLIGIDFTEADNTVLDLVRPLAKAQSAEVTLIHCVPPMSQWVGCYLAYVPEELAERKEEAEAFEGKLAEMVAGLKKEGIEADSVLIEASAGPGIVKHAKENDYDQIVVGTHSRNLLERALLGSSADHVVRKSPVPVLVVPTMV